MDALRWAIGGLVGGAVGAAIWVVVGCGTGYEVGWIAWGVGFLVGFGVRYTSQEAEGPLPGIVAGAVAVVSVLAGKLIVATLALGSLDVDVDAIVDSDPEVIVVRQAEKIAAEYEAAGKSLDWPPGRHDPNVPAAMSYPKDVWTEAGLRVERMTPDQRQAEIDACKEEMEEFVKELRSTVRQEAYREMFSPFDALWFGLAMITAYRVGAGKWGSDD